MALEIGQVARTGNRIEFMRGDWNYPLLQVDLRLAFDNYGHLLNPGETIGAGEWVRRIVKTYAKNKRRDWMIRAICIASRKKAQKVTA